MFGFFKLLLVLARLFAMRWRDCPRVIGLAGVMASGKDTAAKFLRLAGFRRVAWADELRNEVVESLKTGTVPNVAPDDVAKIMRTIMLYDALMISSIRDLIWDKPTPAPVRRLLQWWGTEYRRVHYGADYWVERAISRLHRSGRYVFTDTRMPNEGEAVRSERGEVWLMRRATAGGTGSQAQHASESQVERLGHAREIDNNGSRLDLALNLLDALKGAR